MRRRFAFVPTVLVVGALVALAVGFGLRQCEPFDGNEYARQEHAALKFGAGISDAGTFDSGPAHEQVLDCTGCVVGLLRLRDLMDIRDGYAAMDAGVLVSMPQPSTVNAVPWWLPQTWQPPAVSTLHYSRIVAHPVFPGRYLIEVGDDHRAFVAAEIAADAQLIDAGLAGATIGPRDPSWDATPIDGGGILPDGAILLVDGGIGP